jgi:hypothetical protein
LSGADDAPAASTPTPASTIRSRRCRARRAAGLTVFQQVVVSEDIAEVLVAAGYISSSDVDDAGKLRAALEKLLGRMVLAEWKD